MGLAKLILLYNFLLGLDVVGNLTVLAQLM